MKISLALGALVLGVSFGCGGSSSSSAVAPSPTPSTQGTAVSIVAGASAMTTSAYAPNPVSLAVGGTVMWINNDNTTHTSTSDGGVWNSGSIAPGGTYSQTFATAGTYTYHCTIHPGMVGTITVQ